MENFIQENRFIAIATALAPNKLLLRSFSGTEAISNLFTFQLELLSEDHNIDVSQILGKSATITLRMPDGVGKERYFNGFINRFRQLPGIGRFACYQAEMVPWLWFLTRTTDCRIFQKMTVPDIVETIFKEFNFQDFKRELQQSYKSWEYCVQYRESACNFVMRLMEAEGIFFYFQHEKNRHVLVMADSQSAHKALDPLKIIYEFVDGAGYKQGESRIDSWLINHDLRAGRYAAKDFNFETPSNSLLSKINSSVNLADSEVYELYDYPGGYEKRDEGEKYVRMRMEEEEVEHATIHAEGNCRHFNPAFRFELTEHNRRDQNKAYILTSVTHSASIGGNFPDLTGPEDHHYRNRFTCIPYTVPFRPGRHTPKPIVRGTQTAIVVGPSGEEIHTDKYGRVKVQFHWDRRSKANEDSSCWIRVASSWAGKNWGMIAIPRIGQEVIVDFLEGDPDRPIIIGRVYNAEQIPPYDLPAGGVVSGIKSNTHKGKGYNELSMDDTAGKEKITIHSQYDMNTTVRHDDTQAVHNNRTITVDGTHTETIKKDAKVTITDGSYTLQAKKSITVQVGKSSIYMDSDGQIKIEGKNITINGEFVYSEGKETNTIVGGMVKINP